MKLPLNTMFQPKVPPVEKMCEKCPFRGDGKGYARNHKDFPAIVQQVALGM